MSGSYKKRFINCYCVSIGLTDWSLISFVWGLPCRPFLRGTLDVGVD